MCTCMFVFIWDIYCLDAFIHRYIDDSQHFVTTWYAGTYMCTIGGHCHTDKYKHICTRTWMRGMYVCMCGVCMYVHVPSDTQVKSSKMAHFVFKISFFIKKIISLILRIIRIIFFIKKIIISLWYSGTYMCTIDKHSGKMVWRYKCY